MTTTITTTTIIIINSIVITITTINQYHYYYYYYFNIKTNEKDKALVIVYGVTVCKFKLTYDDSNKQLYSMIFQHTILVNN